MFDLNFRKQISLLEAKIEILTKKIYTALKPGM